MNMNDGLTFESAGTAGVHHARCEACQADSHYLTPTRHSWASVEDIEHAAAFYRLDPSTRRCACPCVDNAEFCETKARAFVYDSIKDEMGYETLTLTSEPCPVCGEPGACGYDTEGRAMIHATASEDEE